MQLYNKRVFIGRINSERINAECARIDFIGIFYRKEHMSVSRARLRRNGSLHCKNKIGGGYGFGRKLFIEFLAELVFERDGAVPLRSRLQMKSILQTVGGYLPCFGQSGYNFSVCRKAHKPLKGVVYYKLSVGFLGILRVKG